MIYKQHSSCSQFKTPYKELCANALGINVIMVNTFALQDNQIRNFLMWGMITNVGALEALAYWIKILVFSTERAQKGSFVRQS